MEIVALAAVAPLMAGFRVSPHGARATMIKRREKYIAFASTTRKGMCLALAFIAIGCPRLIAEQRDCFAYIKNGAIVLQCGDNVSTGEDIGVQGFALSQGGLLGIMRSSSRPIGENGDELVNKSVIVDLRSGQMKESASYPDDFSATCGELLSETPLRDGVSSAWTGAPAETVPFVRYRCSSNRVVLVGQTNKSDDLVLVEGSRRSKLEKTAGATTFEVSPNGTYLAYGNTGRVCVSSGINPPRCLPAEPVGDISVSDKGVVLFTQGTSQNCVYVDSWHFKPEPLSSSHKKQDQCSAIMLWRPGMPLAKEVVPIGRQPQWVPDVWVSALKSWLQDRRPISARSSIKRSE